MIFSQKSIFATCIYSQQAWFYIHYLSYYLLVNSPIGEIFRARLRQFPALVNCCTIDWFSPWPQEALQSVAWRFLGDLTDLDDGSNIPGIVSTVKPHLTVISYTVTDSFVCVSLWVDLGQYFCHDPPCARVAQFVQMLSYIVGLLAKSLEEHESTTNQIHNCIILLLCFGIKQYNFIANLL